MDSIQFARLCQATLLDFEYVQVLRSDLTAIVDSKLGGGDESAPVPPAGGEVERKDERHWDGEYDAYGAGFNACIDQHVTRLQAEVERLTKAKDAYADSARGWKQYSDTQQSELTKARELNADAKKVIEQFMPNVGKCFGIDFMLLNETLMVLAQQSAPAAKLCPQPQAHPARCGCEQE